MNVQEAQVSVDAGRVAGTRRIFDIEAPYGVSVENSLAIRMDMPSSLAFCTASHLAC